MLFSAVSLFIVSTGTIVQQQAALEDPAWTRIKASVVTLDNSNERSGMAVLIDERGYFLAHRSAFSGTHVLGNFSDHTPVGLELIATDDVTQLSLLQAENWINRGRTVVSVSTQPVAGSKLIAATTSGPIKGEFVTDQKVGQMRPTLRYTPLSEIRLESNINKVGGAMVFDAQGRLIGVLGATLTMNQSNNIGRGGLAGGAKSKAVANDMKSGLTENYGPQGMTVAYSLGPSVIKRVIDGLLSSDHKVKHPSLGLFFKNSSEPGALIEAVMAGLPAAEAGIQVGDLVTAVDGTPIKSQVDLAIKLFNHSVGDRITITLKRGEQELTVTVVVGSQESDN